MSIVCTLVFFDNAPRRRQIADNAETNLSTSCSVFYNKRFLTRNATSNFSQRLKPACLCQTFFGQVSVIKFVAYLANSVTVHRWVSHTTCCRGSLHKAICVLPSKERCLLRAPQVILKQLSPSLSHERIDTKFAYICITK